MRLEATSGRPASGLTQRPAWCPGDVFAVALADPSRTHPSHAQLTTRGHARGFLEGALHDRDELAAALDLDATIHTDTELLLAAYERWDAGAFGRLRGSFAFGLIDDRRGAAYVARDPVGHHPFYVAETGGCLLASTSQRALAAAPGVSAALNPVAIADRLCHRWVDPDETLLTKVRRVHPGTHLSASGGRITTARHWDPAGPMVRWTAADLSAAFDAALDRAVVRALSGGGRSGIFLSGGLDSISIAGAAVDLARTAGATAPLALSIGFPDPACDERLTQRSVARDLGLAIDLVNFDDSLGGRGLLEHALDLTATLDGPLLNPWAPVYVSLARRAMAAGVRTILTGSGGDEWLTVSPYLAADLLRAGRWGRLAGFVRTWQRSSTLNAWAVARSTVWRFGVRPLVGSVCHRLAPGAWTRNRLGRALASDPAWLSTDAALRRAQAERAEQGLCDPAPAEGFYAREMRQGLDHQLVLVEHEEYFRWGVMSGTTLQHPYWDPEVIALLYTAHPHDLDDGGRNKGLVRGTLARRFPALGFDRQRKVLSANFFAGIARRQGPDLARRLGSLRGLASLGVVDAARASAFVNRAWEQDSRTMLTAWELVNFETWVRNHL
jgi:asparagine synthase (glutamine-hydrolysing)